MAEEDREEQEQNAAAEEKAQEETQDEASNKARGKDDLKVIRDKFTAHDTTGGGGTGDN